MRQGAGGSARHRVRQSRRAPLRNDHAVRSRGQRGADDCAQVVWILDAVEQHNQPFLSAAVAGIRGRENVVEGGSRAGSSQGHYALMILGIGQAVELAALLKSHGDVSLARQLHDFLHARILPPARDHDAVERAARFQSLAHRVYSRQPVHLESSRKLLAARSIHRSAKLQNPLPCRLHWSRKRKPGGFIQKQNHAVEFAFAGAPGQRQPDGMKQLAPANVETVLQFGNDLLESVGSQRYPIQKQKRKLAQHVARRVARQHHMGVDARQNLRRFVMEDQAEEAAERASVCGMSAENQRRVLAPRQLFGRWLPGEPTLLAKDARHVCSRERVHRNANFARTLFWNHRQDSIADLKAKGRKVNEAAVPQLSLSRGLRWLRLGQWRRRLRSFLP